MSQGCSEHDEVQDEEEYEENNDEADEFNGDMSSTAKHSESSYGGTRPGHKSEMDRNATTMTGVFSTLGLNNRGGFRGAMNTSEDMVNIGTGSVNLPSTLNTMYTMSDSVIHPSRNSHTLQDDNAPAGRDSRTGGIRSSIEKSGSQAQIRTSSQKSNAASAQETPHTGTPVEPTTGPASGAGAGRVETVNADGTRLISYRNGTKKEVRYNISNGSICF